MLFVFSWICGQERKPKNFEKITHNKKVQGKRFWFYMKIKKLSSETV